MSKKILSAGIVMVLIASVFVGVGATTASAQSMNMCQLVDALALTGVIAPDKVDAAKAAAGCTGATTASASYTFTRDLTIGSTGADVTALQNFLISNGNVIAAGATGYFGAQTQAALAAYQAAKGIAPASGYFGPLTRASVNAASTPVVVVPPTTGDSTPATSNLEGGAGDLTSVTEFTAGIEDVVAEDSSEKVLGIELEADDESDLGITSMKFTLKNTGSASGSTRIDRYIESVDIMQGSTKVGSADASDFTKSGTTYSKSVALKNAVVNAGDEVKFYVVINTVSSIDSATDESDKWTVELTQIRYTDATGAILTDSISGTIDAEFGFEDIAANDEIKLQASSANPAATTLAVDEDNASDDYMIFAFKLKADSDSSDLNVLTIPVAMQITSASGTVSFTSDELIDDIWLEADGETYDDFDNTVITVATTSATSTTYSFNIDEGDLEIEAGDTVEVKVYVKFGSQEGNYPVGTTIKASVTGSGIEVENISGDSVDSPTGSANGNIHTVQLEAVNFLLKSVTTGGTPVSDVAPYVTVTMPLQIDSDETLYILKDSTASAVDYDITSGVGTTTVQFTNGTGAASVVSDGSNDYYEISGTKTVYVKFTVNGSTTGSVQNVNIQLNSIDAATEMSGSTVTYDLAPASSFDADVDLLY